MEVNGIKFKKCEWCERELPIFEFRTKKQIRNKCQGCFTETIRIKRYDEPLQDIKDLKEKFKWENWKNKRMVSKGSHTI